MALKQAGSSSTFQLLMSSFWTILMLLGLIAGHVVLVVFLYLHFFQSGGMSVIVEHTGLPSPLLWGSIIVSFLLDLWIFLSGKKEKKKAKRRF